MPFRVENLLLTPLSWLYEAGVWVHNRLYSSGMLTRYKSSIPTICVGNIAVGGTGKTPTIEMLLGMLTPQFRVAVISRGYKRKSRGAVRATPASDPLEIGDEPAQTISQYPQVMYIVDADRVRALEQFAALRPEERPEVVLLDDGLQHKAVQADLNILLIRHDSLPDDDKMLPLGRLREPASARLNAEVVLVTKCPPEMSPMDRRLIERNLALYPHQSIFFSQVVHLAPRPLFASDPQICVARHAVAIAGIAHPNDFFEALARRYTLVAELPYPDHHPFTGKDIDTWLPFVEQYPDAVFATTHKDAMRLKSIAHKLPDALRERLIYLPVKSEIIPSQQYAFQQSLLHWVQKISKAKSSQHLK